MVLSIGFSGMKVTIGDRVVSIYGDRSCPSNRIYMLELPSWRLWHTGDLPGFLGEVHRLDPEAGRVGGLTRGACRLLRVARLQGPSHNLVAQVAIAS